MGLDAVCKDTILPLASGMCTRNTSLTRVFFLPMSVSPLRSSMSAFRSFRIPAQSMLQRDDNPVPKRASSASWVSPPQTRFGLLAALGASQCTRGEEQCFPSLPF